MIARSDRSTSVRFPTQDMVEVTNLTSGGKGSGKELLLKLVLAPLLAGGGHGIVFDIDRRNRWMEDIDSVEVHTAVNTMHTRLMELRDEISLRTLTRESHIEEHGTSVAADAGPQLLIFIDSQRVTRELLHEHWTNIRGTDDLVASPAVATFDALEFTGPGVNIHVLRGQRSRGGTR